MSVSLSSRNTGFFQPKKILVSTDGSSNADRGIRVAFTIAKDSSAELLIVHVVSEPFPSIYSPTGVGIPSTEYPIYFQIAEKAGKKLIDRTVEIAKSERVNAVGKVINSTTSTVDAILDLAEKENVDLIIVGTRGMGGFKKLLLGGVSSAIVSHAHCSVLVVR